MDDRQKGCALGCGVLSAIFMILMIGSTTWMRQRLLKPAPPAPAIFQHVALRPRYILKDGRSIEAGYAVAVRLHPGGDPVLLTPLDVFGPEGKVLTNYTAPAALPSLVDEVQLMAVGGTDVIAHAHKPLRTEGLTPAANDPFVDTNLAAFKLDPGGSADVLDLAPENPPHRSWVWMVGDLPTHQPQVQSLFPARVNGEQDRQVWIYFQGKVSGKDVDGAPVVNDAQQVAGMLIRGYPGRSEMLAAGAIRRILARSNIQ